MLTVIVILTALNALAFAVRSSVRIENSGAVVGELAVTGSAASLATDLGEPVRSRPSRCPDARRAIVFYHSSYHGHLDAMRAVERRAWHDRGRKCGWAEFLAERWQRRAVAAREVAEKWRAYHYDWANWLPDKWARIGACETGYGQRPGNWRHSNSSYEGAFGFAKSSWDAFKWRADPKAGPYPEDAWQATPRQQYEVALAIWRAYGFSGWGCRGA